MAKRKMPNNPITLRKSTTEEKLMKILEGLFIYYLDELRKYENKLKDYNEKYPSPENEEKLKKIENYRLLQFFLRTGQIKFGSKQSESVVSDPLKVKITRYELKQIISGAIDVFNNPTISNWIGYLINHEYLRQNPDSNLIMKKSFNGVQTIEIIMPRNDTRYFIDPYNILKILSQNNDCESSSPQNQAEKKDGSSDLKSPKFSTSNE